MTDDEKAMLNFKIENLYLSTRLTKMLKASDINTLLDIVKHNRNDMYRYRGLGKKSLNELDEVIDSLGLSFGMNISK